MVWREHRPRMQVGFLYQIGQIYSGLTLIVPFFRQHVTLAVGHIFDLRGSLNRQPLPGISRDIGSQKRDRMSKG